MSTNRVLTDRKLVKGPGGRNLCRWCHTEVQPPKITFCSEECVHQWKLRAQPSYVRLCVERRDKGVCAGCGLDTVAHHRKFNPRVQKLWQKYSRVFGLDFKGLRGLEWQDRERILRGHDDRVKARVKVFCRRIGYIGPTRHGHLWEADHIIPVSEGGGECGLENYRTLCLRCHKDATKALAARRAERKRKGKAA